VIPEGYRAMNVRVDDVVGISGFIMPGALVDVVVVIDPPENDSHRERVSKIVLQNIKVLANGANLDKPKNEKEVERVKTVTLQVTPEQTEKLPLQNLEVDSGERPQLSEALVDVAKLYRGGHAGKRAAR